MRGIETEKLEQWADVNIHALNPDPSAPILLRGEDAQLPALELVAETARSKLGASKIEILTLNPQEMEHLIREGNPDNIRAYHERTEQALQRIIDGKGSVARFAGSVDIDLRSRLQEEYPDGYNLWDEAETTATKLYRDNISSTNALPWLVGYAPAEGDAAKMFPLDTPEVGYQKAWGICFRITLSDQDNAVEQWERRDALLHEGCRLLNDLNIDYVEIKGHGTNATVGFSDLAVYLGGSKITGNGRRVNNNRPSFERWTAPHRERIEGVICSTVPFLCDGVIVDGLEAHWSGGELVSFQASSGADHFRKHIGYEGVKRAGEFALVDGGDNPIDDSVPFTYQTLIEENRRNHLAIGSAYKNNLRGGVNMTKEEQERNGLNHAVKHTDFMWGGSETSVIAVTRDGRRVPIMEQGRFVPPFGNV